MHPAWARCDQCRVLGIAFLRKQWGTYRSNPLFGKMGYRWRKRNAVTFRATAKAAHSSMVVSTATFPGEKPATIGASRTATLCVSAKSATGSKTMERDAHAAAAGMC
jgi:hypothetical protein